jgi:hypothetical protein
VSVILADLAVADLLDCDIGEGGVIEETAKKSGQRLEFCARPRLHWRCIYLAAKRSAESVMVGWLSPGHLSQCAFKKAGFEACQVVRRSGLVNTLPRPHH